MKIGAGSEFLSAVPVKYVFWNVTARSPEEKLTDVSYREKYRAFVCCRFLLVPFFAYSSTLNMEAMFCFKKSVDLPETTLCYVPEYAF
jgi:hypothetical protein